MRWARKEYVVHICNPADARQWYNDFDAFDKVVPDIDLPGTLAGRLLANNIILSNHSDWRRFRRVANAAFHKQFSPVPFFSVAKAAVGKIHAAATAPGGDGTHTVNIADLMNRLTVDAFSQSAFGDAFGALSSEGNRVIELYNEVIKAALNPLYVIFAFFDSRWNPFRAHFFTKCDELDEIFFDMVKRKKEHIQTHGVPDEKSDVDLLTQLVLANEDEAAKYPLSPQELRNNILSFHLAGSDTTSNALACAVMELGRHPEIQQRARAQVLEVLGELDPSKEETAPGYDQQRQLTYLTQIIKETTRLYPSVSFNPPRRALKDTFIGGKFIPKGTSTLVNIWGVHRNPNAWEGDVNAFDPSRFDGEHTDAVVSAKNPAWMPFGGGKRACIGFAFSFVEQRVVLATLLRHFTWRISSKGNQTLKFPISTLLTADNMQIEFFPRHPSC
ncbi:cytochrome P450 [Ramicandelaber brevisporus]|nr:cytochrome P450 [Ramicandelaber brevisporus]